MPRCKSCRQELEWTKDSSSTKWGWTSPPSARMPGGVVIRRFTCHVNEVGAGLLHIVDTPETLTPTGVENWLAQD